MQYKDLKEMTIKEWDGEPFDAYCTDCPDNVLLEKINKVIGYKKGWWLSGFDWKFVYPVEWNKDKVEEALNPKPKRMTNRQLAMWLAKGNGEYIGDHPHCVHQCYPYNNCEANNILGDNYRVRKWDSDEWVEPTVDLLEGV